MTDLWRGLRGADLEQAIRAARWYVEPDDTIGGWCVMPADVPPSSGIPAVASFLSKAAAEHITALHNDTIEETP